MPDPNIEPCQNCGGTQFIDYDKSLYLVDDAEVPRPDVIGGAVRLYTCNQCSLIRMFLEEPMTIKGVGDAKPF